MLRNSFSHYKPAHNDLLQRGYKFLGAGAFSSVYGKPESDTVVKLSRTRPENDGWFAFAAWLRKERIDNIHFPRIHELAHHGSYYMARMERLTNFKELTDNNRRTLASVQRVAWRWSGWEDEIATMSAPLREAVDSLRQFLGGYGLDLHGGNFMQRGDTVVINDPLSFTSYNNQCVEWTADCDCPTHPIGTLSLRSLGLLG